MQTLAVNPKLAIDVIEIAHIFARENDFGPFSLDVDQILTAYSSGLYDLGKKLLSDLCRPEFGQQYYFNRRQLAALLGKVPFPSGNKERRQRTIDTFMQVEDRCKLVNTKFADVQTSFTPDQLRVLNRAKGEIVAILGGDLTDSTYLSCLRRSQPGGGLSGGNP